MPSAADRNRGQSEGEQSDSDEREIAELCALADGTLDVERRRELETRLASSPRLRVLLAEQRRAVDALWSIHRVRAPATLRARIDGVGAKRRRFLVRPALTLTGVAALATVVLALQFILPAGTPSAPSVSQAAALATSGPAAPAPAPDPDNPSVRLGLRVQTLYFPNWFSRFGWRAVGQRVDHLDGRLTATVYYAWQDRHIAYTIVAAPALTQPRAALRRLDGTDLRTLAVNGRIVVTWRCAGSTCVLSGADVPAAQLQQLAAWMPGD